MKNKYQLLANKWKNQADKSSNEQEQMWLYGCAADLQNLNNQLIKRRSIAAILQIKRVTTLFDWSVKYEWKRNNVKNDH